MFAPDVISLRQFYASPLGTEVRALIAASLRELWPELAGDTLLGIGYATPYMESYFDAKQVVIACMPAAQGAVYWPPAGNNVAFIAHESVLPLAESSVNRVLLIHSVENSEQLSAMIDEAWRVLTPGGRLLAVVPNRLGLWARSSHSPFGYGRTFSHTQLRDLLGEHQFTCMRSTSALFLPPLRSRFVWRAAQKVEAFGKVACRLIGGVLLVEAEKQLYAAIRQPVVEARKGYRIPMAKPAMSRFEKR